MAILCRSKYWQIFLFGICAWLAITFVRTTLILAVLIWQFDPQLHVMSADIATLKAVDRKQCRYVLFTKSPTDLLIDH